MLKKVFQIFTDILLVVMFEDAETTGVKQDKNNHNFSITYMVGVVAIPVFLSSIIYFSCCNVNSL